MVAAKVAIIQGMNMSVGSAAPRPERYAIIVTGIKVRPEACNAKNINCALLATFLLGLSSCRLSMALRPKGVAALSRLSRFAEKFIIICPVAGCPLGTSGNILEKKGQINLERSRTPPAFSAMDRNPINKANIPTRGKIISKNAFLAVSITPSTLRTSRD